MRMQSRARRPGFTLPEVLLALALFGALVAVTLGVLNQQVRTFYSGASQADASQNLRFSMSVLDKHVSNLGAGVPQQQPQLIYGDSMVVAFNTDWMSNVAGDLFAVNVDTTMPLLMVTALTKARRITLPGTSWQYPDTTYLAGGLNSPAETVIFWFALDGTTTVTNDYVLWRQVNDQTAEVVARNLLRPSSGRFMRYLRHVGPFGSAVMDSVPTAWLPLRHLRPIHGAANDTAQYARIDNVRAVEFAFRTTDAAPNPATRTYELRRIITLPNAGKTVRKTCGDEPILQSGVNFVAKDTSDAFNTHFVLMRWNASVDEAAGEKDVNRYVIWRDTAALNLGALGDPYMHIPAGAPTYETQDGAVASNTYYYALAAQDCTPGLSNVRTTPGVIVP
jgi:prepilin-type N-terminal cleavage/methylation domain-containing protein